MDKILIVDDSPAARMIARRCVKIAGCTCGAFIEAENGRDALELLKQHAVQLAIVDLSMPVMDGQTLIRFMRSSPRLNRLPVVVVSSKVSASEADLLRRMGVDVVLNKPLSPARMAAALKRVAQLADAA